MKYVSIYLSLSLSLYIYIYYIYICVCISACIRVDRHVLEKGKSRLNNTFSARHWYHHNFIIQKHEPQIKLGILLKCEPLRQTVLVHTPEIAEFHPGLRGLAEESALSLKKHVHAPTRGSWPEHICFMLLLSAHWNLLGGYSIPQSLTLPAVWYQWNYTKGLQPDNWWFNIAMENGHL